MKQLKDKQQKDSSVGKIVSMTSEEEALYNKFRTRLGFLQAQMSVLREDFQDFCALLAKGKEFNIDANGNLVTFEDKECQEQQA